MQMTNLLLIGFIFLGLLNFINGDEDTICTSPEGCGKVKRANPPDVRLQMLMNLPLPLRGFIWYLNKYNKLKKAETSGKPVNLSAEDRKEVFRVAAEKDWQSIWNLKTGDPKQLENAKRKAEIAGEAIYEEIRIAFQEVKAKGAILLKGEPAYGHNIGFKRTDKISTHNSKVGFILEEATRIMKEKFGLSDMAITGLPLLGELDICIEKFVHLLHADFQGPNLLMSPMDAVDTEDKPQSLMGPSISCNRNSPYRTMDGQCNNLKVPLRGAAFTQFKRLDCPDYAGGISDSRKASNGQPLPLSRVVSMSINNNDNPVSSDLSMLHANFGQFIGHDLTATPMLKFEKSKNGPTPNEDFPIKCCHPLLLENGVSNELGRKIGCDVINIPPQDGFYGFHKQKCMDFVRSAPASKCDLGPREQSNEQSAFLDASLVYGVKPTLSDIENMREQRDGLLKVTVNKYGQSLLPVTEEEIDSCNVDSHMNKGEFCFQSGDGRVNEVPPLTSLHIVFLREHNRVAKIMKQLFPSAGDEELFQKARRIIIAELQHIVFNEFLPTVLPMELLKLHKMVPLTGSMQSTDYNNNEDASIANSFATAAWRFGHSEIPKFVINLMNNGSLTTQDLATQYFTPFPLYERNSLADICKGATMTPAYKVDSSFTDQVSGYLFRGDNPFGLDLLAINVQRGRDHGLQGYTKWLAKCGKTDVNSFEDLIAVMDMDRINQLKRIYTSVHDIDLYVGGVSETHVPGGLLGYTFTCLVTDQFRRIKFGDRFWYEEKGQSGSFTPEQMKTLHQVSLARILCDNIPELKKIPRFPLRQFGPGNPMASCRCRHSSIPRYDFGAWRE